MKKKKPKSLGRIESPRFDIKSFNGSTGQIVLKVSDLEGKRIYLDIDMYHIDRLTEVTHALIGKYQEHIDFEQAHCKRLKERATYKGK